MTAGITAMSRAETATPVFAEKKARRRTRKALGPKLAVFSFLLMAAAFFCVPLYVIVVTAFKSMDEIRLGNIFSLPQVWTVEGWHYAMFEACSGTVCSGLSMGFFNSLYILAPSLVLSIAGFAVAVCSVIGLKWVSPLLGLAMGMQTAAATRFGRATVNTVYITGDVQRLFEGVVAFLWPRPGTPPPADVGPLALVWLVYFCGALIGAFADLSFRYALLIPAAILPFVLLRGEVRR